MRVYISAARGSRSHAKELAETFEEVGIEVPCTWWESITDDDRVLSPTDARRIALSELAAIQNADIFLLLTPEEGLGARSEFGYALGCRYLIGRPLVWMVGSTGKSLFDWCADRQFEAHEGPRAVVMAAQLWRDGMDGLSR